MRHQTVAAPGRPGQIEPHYLLGARAHGAHTQSMHAPGTARRSGVTDVAALQPIPVQGKLPGHHTQTPQQALSEDYRDPEIGQLFEDLRAVLRLTPMDAAQRLRVPVHVIAALEAGAIDRLPAWPQTERIIVAYTGLAGIPSQGVLERVSTMLVARQRARRISEDFRALQENDEDTDRGLAYWLDKGRSIVSAAPAALTRWRDRPGGGAVVRQHQAVKWAVAGLAVILILVFAAPAAVLHASALRLPEPISGLVRSFSDQLLMASAPVREGHRWIEVSDPRSRRADRLPSPRS